MNNKKKEQEKEKDNETQYQPTTNSQLPTATTNTIYNQPTNQLVQSTPVYSSLLQ